MATSNKVAVGLTALALALVGTAGAVASAQDRPESLLPPGFDQPAPTPSATPTRPPAGAPAGPVATPQPAAPAGGPTPDPSPTPSPSATIDPATLAQYELPDYARRSLDWVGVAGPDGLPADAFGRADGRFLQTLMRRLDAPIASRWLSIALRQALVSAVATPGQVNGADFAAERAWLLIRMGEARAARAVVQGVDPDNATPKLIQITMQAGLATADPAALCPYAERGYATTGESGWVLARAMCQALAAEPGPANAAITAIRRRGVVRGVDLGLAEKVVGAGADGRRAVTIEWQGIDRLTAWRWGLAAATGVDVPDELMTTAGPQVRYWRALAPVYAASARAADAERAAAQGVLSNLALVDLYGEVGDTDDTSSAASAVARDLRAAYVAPTAAERLTALKALWDEPTDPAGRYARLVLTARAAARVRPADSGDAADRLVASMLSAGLDRRALRWAGAVETGGDGWAMLMLADPRRGQLSYGDATGYTRGGAKAAMLFAGLAGLGRLSSDDIARGADDHGLALDARDPWSRAIDAAARADQPGTVILLCAVGMQTRDWRGVRPAALYRMVAALRATGLEGYARMIAAEAIARLPA